MKSNHESGIIIKEKDMYFEWGDDMILSRHRMSMDQAIKKLVEEFSEYIKEIYLYGSCARGEQKFSSDVDLFVRVKENTPSRVLRKMRIEAMPDEENLPEVDLKFTSGESFSQSYRFNENIKKEGKLIWKKD